MTQSPANTMCNGNGQMKMDIYNANIFDYTTVADQYRTVIGNIVDNRYKGSLTGWLDLRKYVLNKIRDYSTFK